MRYCFIKSSKQRGAILGITLILLLVVTFIALAFGHISTRELKSAKNYANRLEMLVTAETALLEAESDIDAIDSLSSTIPHHFHDIRSNPGAAVDPFNDNNWKSSSTIKTSGNAKYYIEVVDKYQSTNADTADDLSVGEGGYGEDTTIVSPGVVVFRTVIRAESQSGTGVFLIESFYDRKME